MYLEQKTEAIALLNSTKLIRTQEYNFRFTPTKIDIKKAKKCFLAYDG